MKTFPSPSLLPGIEKWKAPILSPAEIHLYLLRFDPEIEPPWVQEYRDILSAEERKSCDSMGSFDRRREYLLSRLMARFFLSGYTSQKMKSLTFTRSEYGKPFLQNFPLPFNLSHTQGLIALAVGRMELGVDIEKVETTMESESRCQILARRFFTREESDFIETLPQNEKSRGFFRLFTLKEAMGKAMGTGLKGAFTLGNIPLPPPERFTIGRWNCYSKDFKAEGYTLALAAETGEETFPLLQIFHWDENSLWIQKQVLEHECLYG